MILRASQREAAGLWQNSARAGRSRGSARLFPNSVTATHARPFLQEAYLRLLELICHSALRCRSNLAWYISMSWSMQIGRPVLQWRSWTAEQGGVGSQSRHFTGLLRESRKHHIVDYWRDWFYLDRRLHIEVKSYSP
jgi:hypothetical protein